MGPSVDSPRGANDSFRLDTLDQAFGSRWGLDDAQSGLPVLPCIQVDGDFGDAQGSTATAWLGEGWSAPEPWGVWSDGELASVIVALDTQASASVGVEIQLVGNLFMFTLL